MASTKDSSSLVAKAELAKQGEDYYCIVQPLLASVLLSTASSTGPILTRACTWNSTSASVAVKCADSGLSTLVISTDPAHSLGDALDQAVGGGQPVRVAGIDNLWAMEVDATEAIKVRAHVI
jgi:Anion-transporting ATPase